MGWATGAAPALLAPQASALLLSYAHHKSFPLFYIMVYKEMTIRTEPCKISQNIIFVIMINVMNGEYSFVPHFTELTYLWHFCTKKQCPIGISSPFPIRVCLPYVHY